MAVIGQRGLYETTVEHITEAADVGKGIVPRAFRLQGRPDLAPGAPRGGRIDLRGSRRRPRRGHDPCTAAGNADPRAARGPLGRRRDLVVLLHQVRGLLIRRPEARAISLRQEYHRRYVNFLTGRMPARPGSAIAPSPADARTLACASGRASRRAPCRSRCSCGGIAETCSPSRGR
ncbi:MAG: hypothetical protein M0C28_11605 [Candidatus Moduliflexus flocculans]|nr:hypothetical protein [Candidatus Moduliflexus flocculans]